MVDLFTTWWIFTLFFGMVVTVIDGRMKFKTFFNPNFDRSMYFIYLSVPKLFNVTTDGDNGRLHTIITKTDDNYKVLHDTVKDLDFLSKVTFFRKINLSIIDRDNTLNYKPPTRYNVIGCYELDISKIKVTRLDNVITVLRYLLFPANLIMISLVGCISLIGIGIKNNMVVRKIAGEDLSKPKKKESLKDFYE